jgi:hypothetical protein
MQPNQAKTVSVISQRLPFAKYLLDQRAHTKKPFDCGAGKCPNIIFSLSKERDRSESIFSSLSLSLSLSNRQH